VLRIGVMGGTFDPIHNGHLILAEQALSELKLDKVLFITASNPPHKFNLVITDANIRYKMAEAAIGGNPNFELSDLEMKRSGASYTVDTLIELKRDYKDNVELFLLMGADEAAMFSSWKDPEIICTLAKVVVANRPGFTVEDAIISMPASITDKIIKLQIPGIDISSTQLRLMVKLSKAIKYLVPLKVEELIISEGLYK
jgi:nicotinate-nucleotide adenylyltransferase